MEDNGPTEERRFTPRQEELAELVTEDRRAASG
jgi:hypothetical protein